MPRALVVIEDPDRDRPLLERARDFAVGAETDVVILALTTPDEYEEIETTLDAIGRVEHTSYDEGDVLEAVTGDIEDLADDVLGSAVDHDLRTAVTDPGDQAERIVDVARRTECDHVFLPGKRRSPTGKAVFGDRTQRVILDFRGYVTVSMD